MIEVYDSMHKSYAPVSFVKADNYSEQAAKSAIQNSLKLIQFEIPKTARKIAIKPNMCYYWDYSTGYTTDPKFVAALINFIREQTSNVEISIVESDASAMKCRYAFPLLGYEKLAKELDVNLVNLSEDPTENFPVTVDGQNFDILVPGTLQKADLRINVPKIKYMDSVTITCALKNIFGCNPMPLKYKFHPKLHETIVALNKAMKFHLHILDGLIVLGAFPKKLNFVMASTDPVAFDSAAARIAGENPDKIRYITLAQKECLGHIRYELAGLDPKIIEKEFPQKKTSDKLVASAYALALKTRILPRK